MIFNTLPKTEPSIEAGTNIRAKGGYKVLAESKEKSKKRGWAGHQAAAQTRKLGQVVSMETWQLLRPFPTKQSRLAKSLQKILIWSE